MPMLAANTVPEHTKRPYSSYVTRVFGLQHTLQSSCYLRRIDALIVKIQNFLAFRYYLTNHSSRITAKKVE